MNFISLREVLESINKFVPVDEQLVRADELEDFIQGDPAIFGWSKECLLERFNHSVSEVVRFSESSCAVDAYMHNFGDMAPRWYDRSQTGRPKLSKAAEVEGFLILSHMANAFERLKDGVYSGKIRYTILGFDWIDGENLYRNKNDRNRLDQIGFEVEELREFLRRSEIPNGLIDQESAQAQDESDLEKVPFIARHAEAGSDMTVAVSVTSGEASVPYPVRIAQKSGDPVSAGSTGVDLQEGAQAPEKILELEAAEKIEVIPKKSDKEVWLKPSQVFMGGGRSKSRRQHPLDSFIRDAQLAVAKLGGNPTYYVEVWRQLVEIARKLDASDTIKRVGRDGTIYFSNGKGVDGEYRPENLRSRFAVWKKSVVESEKSDI